MLAVYEIEATETITQREVNHNKAPFKLVILGVGSNACSTVQYAVTTQLDEKQEIHVYGDAIRRLSSTHTTAASIPLLAFARGTQTQRRQQKATALREHILNKTAAHLPSQEPDVSSLNIQDEHLSQPHRHLKPGPSPSSTVSKPSKPFSHLPRRQQRSKFCVDTRSAALRKWSRYCE